MKKLVYSLVVIALLATACSSEGATAPPTVTMTATLKPSQTPKPTTVPATPLPPSATPIPPTATSQPTPTESLATTTATTTPEPTPMPELPAEAIECQQDPIGCIEIAPGDPIRLAYMFVISGPDESLGTDTARGVEMAVKDQAEILGHPIEIVPKDSQCNPNGGERAAQEVADDPTIVAVIGTNCSSAARASVEIISQAGLVMVSPSNSGYDLTDPASHQAGYARTSPNNLLNAKAAAEFAWDYLGARTAATIHDGSSFADSQQQAFAREFEALGGVILAQEATQPTDTDMHPVLNRIAAASPDVIFYPIYIAAGSHVTVQAQEVAGLEDTALVSTMAMFFPSFLEAAGEAAVGVYMSTWRVDAFTASEPYADFLDEYEREYGEPPIAPYHAHAYDAARLIFAAIEEVALEGQDGRLYIGRQALRDAVYATRDFPGVTGNLSCDQYGDCADPPVGFYEVISADPDDWDPGSEENSNPKEVWFTPSQ